MGVLPTYVGVIPVVSATAFALVGAPHVCGGDPDFNDPGYAVMWCSPRMWG